MRCCSLDTLLISNAAKPFFLLHSHSQPPAISYFVAMVKQARLTTQSINLYPEDVTCLPTNAVRASAV